MPSFGGEVKPSVPCRRFAACKRSLNLRESEFRQNYYRTSFSPTVPSFAARISRVVADGGIWRLKWEHLKAGESNGKLPPRTCPRCSVPEPCRSHDWALVPAKPGLQGWILMNEFLSLWLCCYILWLWQSTQQQAVSSAGWIVQLIMSVFLREIRYLQKQYLRSQSVLV